MTLSDDLRAAKGLIDTPEKWLKGNLADKGNTCFCTFGAAQFGPQRKWSKGVDTAATLALVDALPEPFRSGVATKHRLAVFNDHPSTTHADIMALFNRAISTSEAPHDQN